MSAVTNGGETNFCATSCGQTLQAFQSADCESQFTAGSRKRVINEALTAYTETIRLVRDIIPLIREGKLGITMMLH